ncbi:MULTISPECIES: hypothetical protein [Gordonia]|uniref:Uncharacterized protein n=1 Tax=Gordonia amicalis TaxID=89053 RepID=A0ABU4DAR3_9ACTN|nr:MULTISPECIES: hypothetical protein [Gordonia]ATD70172.1 hypothetical protein CNO18_07740 [Gordonia sp. 1D]MCZ4652780.1 hypothetical protein [Gordonia amicalis]MDV6306810.1 hypothetical protein [Gordonia amicalis]
MAKKPEITEEMINAELSGLDYKRAAGIVTVENGLTAWGVFWAVLAANLATGIVVGIIWSILLASS